MLNFTPTPTEAHYEQRLVTPSFQSQSQIPSISVKTALHDQPHFVLKNHEVGSCDTICMGVERGSPKCMGMVLEPYLTREGIEIPYKA